MGRYLDTKEHKDWRRDLIARDGACVVCGKTERLSAHHLIPKNIIKFRSDINNGIVLCGSHHSGWGFGLSPHSHGAVLFFLWMQKNRPEILKWVEEHYEI